MLGEVIFAIGQFYCHFFKEYVFILICAKRKVIVAVIAKVQLALTAKAAIIKPRASHYNPVCAIESE